MVGKSNFITKYRCVHVANIICIYRKNKIIFKVSHNSWILNTNLTDIFSKIYNLQVEGNNLQFALQYDFFKKNFMLVKFYHENDGQFCNI